MPSRVCPPQALVRLLQRQAQMFVAQRPVLQGLRAFGHHQVGQGAQLHAALRAVATVGPELGGQRGERALLRQRALRSPRGTQKTPRQQVRNRVHQRSLHGALFLLRAPAASLAGQRDRRGQSAQSQMHQEKQAAGQQQRQIERQIDAVRRPKQRDDRLVVAGEQGHRHRNGEQGNKPEGGAHR